eukprot:1156725-Pelagomonas_calceolata.AAC.4
MINTDADGNKSILNADEFQRLMTVKAPPETGGNEAAYIDWARSRERLFQSQGVEAGSFIHVRMHALVDRSSDSIAQTYLKVWSRGAEAFVQPLWAAVVAALVAAMVGSRCCNHGGSHDGQPLWQPWWAAIVVRKECAFPKLQQMTTVPGRVLLKRLGPLVLQCLL